MGGRQAGHVVARAGVVAAGLALGFGAIVVLRPDGKPDYRPQPRSVSTFAFSTVPPGAAPAAEVVPPPEVEPSDPKTALVDVLQAMTDGTPDRAYPLLDGPSHKRFSTLASWIVAQANVARPLTFGVGAPRPTGQPDTFDFDVAATHTPSLDSFRGLVPARSQSVWEVRSEGGTWRVAGAPGTFRPILPPDGPATGVVQDWLDGLATCDTTAAARLQVSTSLYGPSGLVRAPCDKRGAWSAGAPVGLDATPDPQAFIAAFGPDVGTWARLVPVQGPGSRFLAAVAPIGDSWQVMGVAIAG